MLRRGLLALALIVASLSTLAIGSAPAQAFCTNCLTVITYYNNAAHQTVIGQRWTGCNTSGSWGTTSGYIQLFFPPC